MCSRIGRTFVKGETIPPLKECQKVLTRFMAWFRGNKQENIENGLLALLFLKCQGNLFG